MNLNQPMIAEVSRLFRALGDEPRLRLLRVLLEAGCPQCQKVLAEAAGLSQANASKHLIVLVNAGLVTREPHGNLVRFSPVTPLVTDVCERVCAHVAERIKTHHDAIV